MGSDSDPTPEHLLIVSDLSRFSNVSQLTEVVLDGKESGTASEMALKI